MLQEPHLATGTLVRQCSQARATARLLDEATALWHTLAPAPRDPLDTLHFANFELWHLEDQARDTSNGDSAVAVTKRAIDAVNQRRNDTVEAIDASLLAYLNGHGLPAHTAALHSETPGQMLDRLSILSLKIFHTELETVRDDAGQAHRDHNALRLLALREQQVDLADCLAQLWQEILAGERRFKQYRQMKMYNDPALNPVLYAGRASKR